MFLYKFASGGVINYINTWFAFLPKRDSDDNVFWLEKYYTYSENGKFWRGRCKDYNSKINFYLNCVLRRQ